MLIINELLCQIFSAKSGANIQKYFFLTSKQSTFYTSFLNIVFAFPISCFPKKKIITFEFGI